MKNFKKYMILKLCLIASFSLFLFNSCSKDESNNGGSSTLEVTGITAAVVDDPLIENDRQVDVPVDVLNAGILYIIRGSGFRTLKSISFNGLESTFNQTLVTDNAIIVKVNNDTPYYNLMDQVKIVTGIGTLLYTIPIRPPFPIISGFPINPAPGDIITITGKYFLLPVVNFGTTTVEPISSTLTEIKVKVPAGINFKNLSITNVSGTTVAPQAFGTAIYDDAFTNLKAYDGLWDATNTYNNEFTKDPRQGEKCILWKSGAWNGLYVGIDNSKVDISKFSGIRVSMKGELKGSVNVILNGNYSKTFNVKFTDTWAEFEIPFSELASPTELKEIVFQESGNFGGNTVYIDDLGLILKK